MGSKGVKSDVALVKYCNWLSCAKYADRTQSLAAVCDGGGRMAPGGTVLGW